MRTDKQRRPWPWWRRLLREVAVYPLDLDDGSGDGSPSATKILAYVLAFIFVLSVLWQLPISTTQLTLAIVAASVMFGRSTFKSFLMRWSRHESVTETTITQRKEIAQRREQGTEDGSEPTD